MQAPWAWCSLNPASDAIVTCSHCGCFLGGVLGQLNGAAECGVSCVLGCGARYCDNNECASKAFACHSRLCVGPHSESHPLYRFKLLAFRSGAYAEFQLAAKLAVQAAVEPSSAAAPALGDVWSLCAPSQRVPWWELVSNTLDAGEMEQLQELSCDAWALLCQGVPEVGAAATHRAGEDWGLTNAIVKTGDEWGRLLSLVATEKVSLSRASLLETFCARAWNEGAAQLTQAEASGLVASARETLERRKSEAEAEAKGTAELSDSSDSDSTSEDEADDDDDDDDEAEAQQQQQQQDEQQQEAQHNREAMGREEPQLDDSALLNRVLCDPASFFPRLEIMALYPSPRLPHSCVPACAEVLHDFVPPPGGGVSSTAGSSTAGSSTAGSSTTDTGVLMTLSPSPLPALPPADGGDGRTVCLVSVSASVEERNEELQTLGRGSCSCARCVFERSEGGVMSEGVTSEQLYVLLQWAERDSRYADCTAIVDELLRRVPSDGDALLARSRILGWYGRWSASHDALVAGAAIASEHAKMRSTLHGILSYAGWASLAGAIQPATSMSATAVSASTVSEMSASANQQWAAVKGLDGSAFLAPALLDAAECSEVISTVDAELAQRGGWTTSRHYDAPTTDVPVKDVPSVAGWFNRQLESRIYPMLGAQFGVDPVSIRVVDAFVVRYAAEKQRSLPLHTDQSQFSLTVAMNGRDEYDGGGTFFLQTGAVANCETGGVISFDGSLEHSGWPILRGTRYIIVAFLYAYQAGESGAAAVAVQ